MLTSWIDPSVTDESDPLSVDPRIDMFETGNGPPYTPEFVTRYRAAQRARNDRITEWVLGELRAAPRPRRVDRVFTVHRTWADLRFLDLGLDPSDRSAGCYFGDARSANYGSFGLACTSTLRSWLSMWSLAESECRAAPAPRPDHPALPRRAVRPPTRAATRATPRRYSTPSGARTSASRWWPGTTT